MDEMIMESAEDLVNSQRFIETVYGWDITRHEELKDDSVQIFFTAAKGGAMISCSKLKDLKNTLKEEREYSDKSIGKNTKKSNEKVFTFF